MTPELDNLRNGLRFVRREFEKLAAAMNPQPTPKADLARIYTEAPEKTAMAFEYEIVTAALDPTNLKLLWSDAEADLKAYALRIRMAVEKPMREWDTQDKAERQAELAKHWPDDLPAGTPDPDDSRDYDEQFEGGRR